NMHLIRLEAFYWPLLYMILGCSEALLFYFGGTKAATRQMTLGSFVAMFDYLQQIMWPMMALGFTTNIYIRGKVSVERINEVYDAPVEIVDGPGAKPD